MYKSAKYIKNIDIKIRKWYIFNKENNFLIRKGDVNGEQYISGRKLEHGLCHKCKTNADFRGNDFGR